MEKAYTYIRHNWIAFAISGCVLLWFGLQTFAGRECFNCDPTVTYKSDQQHGSRTRFRHK